MPSAPDARRRVSGAFSFWGLMPYPNEHACRLRDPGDFQSDSFRRTTRKHDGKEYSVIMGRLKGQDTMTEQAYRYNKGTWTAESARSHCSDHDGSFEAASDSQSRTPPMEQLTAPFELLEMQPEDGTFSGRALVYDRQFETLWGPLIIEPGAFRESIEKNGDRLVILWQHDHDEPIGRPLELEDRPDGVHVKGKLSQTARGKDALTLLRDRVIRELSAGVQRIEELQEKGKTTRLKRGELHEISLVTFGAAGREGAKVYEVHKQPAQPPLSLTRALGVLAEYELKWGPLPEPGSPQIPVAEIDRLCPGCGEKLKQRGITAITVSDFERMIEEFTNKEK